jgi:hypothetical protein
MDLEVVGTLEFFWLQNCPFLESNNVNDIHILVFSSPNYAAPTFSQSYQRSINFDTS